MPKAFWGGKSFLGIDEVEGYLRKRVEEIPRSWLPHISKYLDSVLPLAPSFLPYSGEKLEQCAQEDEWICSITFPLCVYEMIGLYRSSFSETSDNIIYDGDVALKRGSSRPYYCIMRRKPLAGSLDVNYAEQEGLVRELGRVPSLREVIQMRLFVCRERRGFFLGHEGVRCLERSPLFRSRFCIIAHNSFDSVWIAHARDELEIPWVGITACLKPDLSY